MVGGLPFYGVSGLCTSSLAHRLPGGSQAQHIEKAADAGLGLSLWWSEQLPVIRTPWVALSVVEACTRPQAQDEI